MNQITQMGKDFTKGVILETFKWVGIFAIAGTALVLVANTFQWGVDNSDVDAWNRSGMKLYTDNLTGVQYVRVGDALHVRVDAEGMPILSR